MIIYTGYGGRSLDTGKQVTDQLLTRQNLALVKSCQQGLPIRVIRRKNQLSAHSAESGYRYDGLFRIDSYWKEKGVSGYAVWRFRLMKINDNQKEAYQVKEAQIPYGHEPPERKETLVQRIVRDTAIGREVKSMYDFRCQVCQTQLVTNADLCRSRTYSTSRRSA